MKVNDYDRQLLTTLLDTPAGKIEMGRVTQVLDQDIHRSRFNRDRARQLFLFMIDNCVHRYFKSIGVSAATMFPREVRSPLADELAQNYIDSRGNIESQRPTRRGLLALLSENSPCSNQDRLLNPAPKDRHACIEC
jgi:hypothetical protein